MHAAAGRCGGRAGGGVRRGDGRGGRYGGLLPAAARAPRGRACQPDFARGRRASGRPAASQRRAPDGDLLARTRIPRDGRCGRARRQFCRRAHGGADPFALRRPHAPTVGRGDALVRRVAGRHAGRGSAFLHLLYFDAAHDGCLRRFRPRGSGAGPSQSQRIVHRRPRARHEIQVGRRRAADSRRTRTDDGRDRPHGRG